MEHNLQFPLFLIFELEIEKKFDLSRIRTWNPEIRTQMPYPLGHEANVFALLHPAIDDRVENNILVKKRENSKFQRQLQVNVFFHIPL